MSDLFRFDDAPYPLPAEVLAADPQLLLRDLIYRVARLERDLEGAKLQAIDQSREMLLQFISLADDIAAIVDRYGVTSGAKEAIIIRSVVALGKKLIEILRYHGVEGIDTIGKPYDADVSDVAATEVREGVPAHRVLREVQTGYTWPHGLLRRARVVVSGGEAEAPREPGALEVPGAPVEPEVPEEPVGPEESEGVSEPESPREPEGPEEPASSAEPAAATPQAPIYAPPEGSLPEVDDAPDGDQTDAEASAQE